MHLELSLLLYIPRCIFVVSLQKNTFIFPFFITAFNISLTNSNNVFHNILSLFYKRLFAFSSSSSSFFTKITEKEKQQIRYIRILRCMTHRRQFKKRAFSISLPFSSTFPIWVSCFGYELKKKEKNIQILKKNIHVPLTIMNRI